MSERVDSSELPSTTFTVFLGLFVITFIFVAYFPALNTYLRGDDFEWLNSSYTGWRQPVQLLKLINNFFRPVVKISYLLNYTFFGTNVSIYNLTTIGIHLINVFLLYLLMLKTTHKWILASIIALTFGISSMYSEVTLWAAGRPDSILLCFILAILVVISTPDHRIKKTHHALLFCLTLGALGAKETWVLLPLITISFLWFLKNTSFRVAVKRALWQLILLISYLLIFIGIPLFSHNTAPTSYADVNTLGAMLTKVCHLIVTYCGLHGMYSGTIWQVVLVLVGVFIVIAWIIKSNNRLALWGMLWMGLTICITLPISYEPSRYNYFPLVGFWITVIALFEQADTLLRKKVNFSLMLKNVILGIVLLFYVTYQIIMLQSEINDYKHYGEFHRIISIMYSKIREQIPLQQPILFINKGMQKPFVEIANSTHGYPKLFFVRPSAIWELVDFNALANFMGDPFHYSILPIRQNLLDTLEQRVTVVTFTDRGFVVTHEDHEVREELQRLYAINGRLPDNVTFHKIVPIQQKNLSQSPYK